MYTSNRLSPLNKSLLATRRPSQGFQPPPPTHSHQWSTTVDDLLPHCATPSQSLSFSFNQLQLIINSINFSSIPSAHACQRLNTSPQTPDFVWSIFYIERSISDYHVEDLSENHGVTKKMFRWAALSTKSARGSSDSTWVKKNSPFTCLEPQLCLGDTLLGI